MKGSSAARAKGEAAGSGRGTLDRETRKTARRLIAEVERLSSKHEKRVGTKERQRLDSAIASVRKGLEAEDKAMTRVAVDELDDRASQILGFAKKSTAREYGESIIIAIAIALVLRSFVVEAFKIPTGSMVPTLEVGDHIFVNKFIYGLRVPFTNAWFVQWSEPERGDVIVFRYPPDPSKDYIKRVVAVAGDEVAVRGHTVYVNGEPLPKEEIGPRTYLDDSEDDDGWRPRHPEAHQVVAFRESSAEGETTYTVLEEAGRMGRRFPVASLDGGRPVEKDGLKCPSADACVVQEGFVFVMGDNRDNSSDSRVWGAAPVDNVKGKAMFVWGSWGPSWTDFRFERLGRVIQ